MNIVEQVANAIANGPEPLASDYARARDAIKAMREPSDRMLSRADGYTDLVGYHSSCDSTWRKGEFRTAWQAMIDDALNEVDL